MTTLTSKGPRLYSSVWNCPEVLVRGGASSNRRQNFPTGVAKSRQKFLRGRFPSVQTLLDGSIIDNLRSVDRSGQEK